MQKYVSFITTKIYIFKYQMIITLVNPFHKTQHNQPGIKVPITRLPQLTKQNIMLDLLKQQHITPNMMNYNIVTTQPRDYHLDVVLAKGAQFFAEEEGEEGVGKAWMKKIVSLPLRLQIVKPQEEWKIDCHTTSIKLDYFNVLQKIGEGTYSQIFLIQRKYDRHLFCLKRMNKAQCRQKGSLQMIKNQFFILQYGSKYKIKLYYAFQDPKYVFFIEQYCCMGDLYSIIRLNKKVQQSLKLTLTQKYTIWIQIAFGIAHLHSKSLIYRDLKPQNILLNQKGQVKICDFGFARKIQPKERLKDRCGSYEYLAPEVIKGEEYNQSVDLYCLGLLFYQLLVGVNPYEGMVPQNFTQIKSKSINYQKKAIDAKAKDLLKKLMKQKPQQRLGYQSTLQIFKHDFFKQNEDIVVKIVNNSIQMKTLRYREPANLEERKELDQNQDYIFAKGVAFNYLQPDFDVTENIGPKFNFSK